MDGSPGPGARSSDPTLPEDEADRVAELVERALRRQARRRGVDLS